LYVGGKSENIAKWTVWPPALRSETVNELLVELADVWGVKVTVTWFHEV
jgi:hypothetical protein